MARETAVKSDVTKFGSLFPQSAHTELVSGFRLQLGMFKKPFGAPFYSDITDLSEWCVLSQI